MTGSPIKPITGCGIVPTVRPRPSGWRQTRVLSELTETTWRRRSEPNGLFETCKKMLSNRGRWKIYGNMGCQASKARIQIKINILKRNYVSYFENRPKSDFQSQESTGIFLILFSLKNINLWEHFNIIDIFWQLQFLKHFIF